MITLTQALAEQETIQAEGRRLLETVPLVAIFNRYGDYQVGGSLKHGLMIASKADIDGYIVCDQPSFESSLKLFNEVIAHQVVRRAALDKGDGNSLQVKVPFEGRLWNFDVHLATAKSIASLDYLGQHDFTEGQRQLMVLLKAQLHERGLYPGSTKLPGSLSSVDVYRAVLEDGVNDLDGAIAWSKSRVTSADEWRAHH